MHLAKEIIRQAGIPDVNWEPIENDTVGSKIVMKHPGPIVNAREITVKDKQWQDVGSGICQDICPGRKTGHDDSRRPSDS